MTHSPVDNDLILSRQHAERARDPDRTGGLVIVGAAVLAFAVCVATFALGDAGAGVAAAIVALLAFGAGLDWLAMDGRRIRDAERHGPLGHAAR